MVAEAPDQYEGDVYDNLFGAGVHLESTTAQSQALSAFGNRYTPKVRKPYTITKQREKWTDDEHQRFLEALKLYGRAWRQIEEHVGTKTAIQIRSHAQKFFAKVARDSNPDSEGSLNPIEIPPPRPKKKPLHPYPRKVVESQKPEEANANPHEQSSPPSVTGVERDTRSPTSFFSAIGSDTSGSPFSEPRRSSRFSPTSCTTDDAHSVNVLLMENDNECMTSDCSVEEEKVFLESIQVSPPTAMNAKPVMEPDFLTPGGAFSMDDLATDETSTTIKLFGRTLMVNGSWKLFPSATENNEKISNDAANEQLKVRNGQPIQNFPTPNMDPKYAFAFVPGSITPLPCLVPHYAFSEECSCAGVPGSAPWWAWHQGVVFPQVSFGNQVAVDSVVDSPCKREQENETREEGSLTGSNWGSSSDVSSLQMKTNDIEYKVEAKILKGGSAKGFVPYKRCLTERDVTSPIVSVEEREGQIARVCL